MPDPLRLFAKPGRLELIEPFVISRGVEHWYDVVEVGVSWHGLTGWGEATPVEYFGETLDSVVSFVEAWDGQLGDDPFALDAITTRIGAVGGNRAAQAGIDAALHDLCGQASGLPVWRLLGVPQVGPPTARTISLAKPGAMADEAAAASTTFALLKLKLGGRDGLDLDRVAEVSAVTDLPLLVDVNEYWSFDEAVDLIPQLATLGVTHIEQPLPADDPAGPELKARSSLPIIVDEDCHTLSDVAACAERAHGVNVKLAKSGGIREAIRMVHAARALSLQTMLGCMGESTLGIAAHAAIAGLFDLIDLDGNLGLLSDPWTGVELSQGVQVPSRNPGLGVVRCR